MKDTLKQIEEAFDEKFIKTAEHSYKSAVSDQVAAYRHQLENLLEARLFLKSSIVKVLQQLVEREEKDKLVFMTPDKESRQMGYEQKRQDTISYLKSEIATLSTNIDKE